MRAFGTFALFVSLLVPSALYAVTDITLSMEPKHPAPGAVVTITATPLGFSAENVDLLWLLNDAEVGSGYGVSKIQLRAPRLGETAVVRLIADGDERARPLTIRPAQVTLEWEGVWERPPFYIGRPLFGGTGSVSVVAVPEFMADGVRVPPAQVRYTWYENGVLRNEWSGYGRSRLVVTPPFYNRPFSIGVRAEALGQTAEQTLGLRSTPIDAVVYETSPLMGLMDHRAIYDAYNFTQDEVSFFVYALHPSVPESLNYTWKISGTPIAVTSGDPRAAVFKKTGDGEGVYGVGVEIGNPEAFLDRLRSAFLLHF